MRDMKTVPYTGLPALLAAERPRLMATNAAIARARAFIQRNQTAQEWQAEIARRADYMLSLPPLTPTSVLDPEETETAPLPLVRSAETSGTPATLLDIAR